MHFCWKNNKPLYWKAPHLGKWLSLTEMSMVSLMNVWKRIDFKSDKNNITTVSVPYTHPPATTKYLPVFIHDGYNTNMRYDNTAVKSIDKYYYFMSTVFFCFSPDIESNGAEQQLIFVVGTRRASRPRFYWPR